jgi:hypothetical protein
MIHRTSPNTHVSRSRRDAQAHRHRHGPEGASRAVGRAAARARRRLADPAQGVVVCQRTQPDGEGRGPVRLALEGLSCRTGLAGGYAGPGLRGPRAAHAAGAHDGAAPSAATRAAGPAPGGSSGSWLGSHAWEWRHAGPDAGGHAGHHGLGRAEAPVGARGRGRRWGHAGGWVGKRAKRVAKDEAPHRVSRLARIRFSAARWRACAVLVLADDRARHVWPKVGYAWRPQGRQWAVMTPGPHPQHDLAGALALSTGTRPHGVGPRTTKARGRALLTPLEARSPADRDTRLDVVVDPSQSHKAPAVEPWLAAHPRVRRRFVPPDCPRAHPLERACGAVHDGGPRNHQRNRLPALVAEVARHGCCMSVPISCGPI